MNAITNAGRSPLTPDDGFQNLASAPRPAGGGGPAGSPPAGRGARWLARALRAVDDGPRPFYRAAVASLAVTSALAAAIAATIRPPGSFPWAQRGMVIAALLALGVSAVLWLTSRAGAGRTRAVAWPDRVADPRARSAVWLALAAWFPLLLVVVYYRAKATFPPPVRYVYFPFDDKRWQTASYLLAVLAPAVWLIAAARVLTVGRDHPPTWRAWFTGLFTWSARADQVRRDAGQAVHGCAGRRRSRARTMLPVTAGLLTAIGLAWYLAGAPWHLSQTSTPISRQEEVVLIGLQAVAKGHLPYVGVASVQYGPGTQVASYVLMQHVTSFSVVGFREAWAILVWAGVSVLFAVFFLAFGYLRGLAVSLLSSLVYPALHTVGFQPGGSYTGYFGWASPLRYVGVIALVLLLPAVVRRSPSRRGAAAGAAVGVLWGLTSYLAQENLSGGVVGALAAAALLVFSGSASWRAVRAALIAVTAGFLLIWTPVLEIYAVLGRLPEFIRQYLLFPGAVAAGANDTPWHSGTPYTRMFFVLPVLLAGLALLPVLQGRPLRIAVAWSRERVLLVMTVLATALLYEGALLRSDTSHLTGTLLMVPALVIMAASGLPRLLGVKRRAVAAVACVAVVVASFALLPRGPLTQASVRAWAEAPYLDRQQPAAAQAAGQPATLAGARVGPGLADVAKCCQGSAVPMPEFIHLMEQIHALVGDRAAYVANFHGEYPGLVYFVADLNPAPVSSDRYSSIETRPELRAFLADFKARVAPQTQAVLTGSLKAPEAQIFLHRYPDAHRITLSYAGLPYYILLRQQ